MKRFLLACIFTVLAAFAAQAQFIGDVSVTREALCERDGKLYMKLDIRIGRKAIPASQSWMIIPEVSTADRRSVKIFPHILVDGRHHRQMRERRERLCGRYWEERRPWRIVDVHRKKAQHIIYEMEVPYEPWMDDATLVLRQILTSADNSRRVFTVDVNGAVDRR